MRRGQGRPRRPIRAVILAASGERVRKRTGEKTSQKRAGRLSQNGLRNFHLICVPRQGNNDLAQGVGPETVRDTCRAFVEKVREQLPEVRICVVSIPPAILGWAGRDAGMWPVRAKTNRLLKEYCASDEGLTWIDVAEGMFDANGEPRKDIFDTDNLHMNREGYLIWRNAVMPVLIEKELPKERE